MGRNALDSYIGRLVYYLDGVCTGVGEFMIGESGEPIANPPLIAGPYFGIWIANPVYLIVTEFAIYICRIIIFVHS